MTNTLNKLETTCRRATESWSATENDIVSLNFELTKGNCKLTQFNIKKLRLQIHIVIDLDILISCNIQVTLNVIN